MRRLCSGLKIATVDPYVKSLLLALLPDDSCNKLLALASEDNLSEYVMRERAAQISARAGKEDANVIGGSATR